MPGNAIRLSDDLINSVRSEATTMSRSITGQVEHWLRLGRAMERSLAFSYDRVRKALDGKLASRELNDEEDEVYMELFSERMWNPGSEVHAYFAKLGDDIKARDLDTSK